MTNTRRGGRLIAAWRSAMAIVRPLGRSLGLIWHADPPFAAVYLLVMVAQGLIPVAIAWVAKLVLDRTSVVLTMHQAGGAPERLVQSAFAAAVWYVALQFTGRLLQPVQRQIQGNLLADVTAYAERRLMEVGGAIPDLDHFERTAFHDEIALIQGEVAFRPKTLLSTIHSLVTSLLTIGGSLALLWHFQPLLPLVLLVCGIPQVLVYERLQQRSYESITRRSEAARMMGYCATITTEPGAAKELLVYGVGPWFRGRWQQLAQAALVEMAQLRRAGLGATTAIVAGNGLVLAGAYAYVAVQVGSHRLTIGDFALYGPVLGSLSPSAK